MAVQVGFCKDSKMGEDEEESKVYLPQEQGLTNAAANIGGFSQWWKLKDGMFWPLDDSFYVCKCGKNTGLCQQQ